MFGGLYGDLPQAKGSADADGNNPSKQQTGWALSNTKQPAPRSTVASLAPPSVLRAGRGGRGRAAPARGRGPAAGRGPPLTATVAPHPVSSRSVLDPLGQTPAAPSISAVAATEDEYDPARPNAYEQVLKEREKQRMEAEQEIERLRHLEHVQKLAAAAAAAVAAAQQQRPSSGAAPQAQEEERRAALSMSGEEAYLRRGRLRADQHAAAMPHAPTHPAAPTPPEPTAAGGLSAAAKMMQKMGWKAGQGLGKDAQGITTPLVAQKTGSTSAVIVNAPAVHAPDDAAHAAAKRQRVSASLAGPRTRVLLLRNMVGPGQVDDALEDEVGEECSKYGNVNSVLIFEATAPGFPPEEAVRIFVEFDSSDAATKALIDLEGRFFGGRSVRATFFDEQRFAQQDLAPRRGEL